MYYFSKMISFLKDSLGKEFLEVGCGMGTDTVVFAKHGFNVKGVDITEAHLALAEQLFALFDMQGEFIHGNAEKLPFDDNSFGAVYSFGVLHHTLNTDRAIKEIYRVLMPEGRAVIMLYNKWSLNNLAHLITGKGFENVTKGDDSPITKRFSKNEIRSMCSDFSYYNIDIEYLFGAGWGKAYSLVPKRIYLFLSKLIGWHHIVYLVK
ncbi:hypothetical protein MTBBW1_900013 [Desulfamplus magnetovallimortis]|uniref:Methyltransferase type 11 domain-containing protein n=1 Tax=Desulfamplus magnetovallimortis TaxID=1246637 RepID=A0A1W1HL35_9BACT|nr:class I SAM-dependent methyltransferase [Desulfamplus magnetovallimortis]SLM33146.1 hypothetical protein MTBBW1_900013 [Desulfamplus magnetovallimortis]